MRMTPAFRIPSHRPCPMSVFIWSVLSVRNASLSMLKWRIAINYIRTGLLTIMNCPWTFTIQRLIQYWHVWWNFFTFLNGTRWKATFKPCLYWIPKKCGRLELFHPQMTHALSSIRDLELFAFLPQETNHFRFFPSSHIYIYSVPCVSFLFIFHPCLRGCECLRNFVYFEQITDVC